MVFKKKNLIPYLWFAITQRVAINRLSGIQLISFTGTRPFLFHYKFDLYRTVDTGTWYIVSIFSSIDNYSQSYCFITPNRVNLLNKT